MAQSFMVVILLLVQLALLLISIKLYRTKGLANSATILLVGVIVIGIIVILILSGEIIISDNPKTGMLTMASLSYWVAPGLNNPMSQQVTHAIYNTQNNLPVFTGTLDECNIIFNQSYNSQTVTPTIPDFFVDEYPMVTTKLNNPMSNGVKPILDMLNKIKQEA